MHCALLAFVPFVFSADPDSSATAPKPLATLGSPLFRAPHRLARIAYSADGKELVGVGDLPGQLCVWDATTGRAKTTVAPWATGRYPLWPEPMLLSADGVRVVQISAIPSLVLQLFDRDTGRLLAQLPENRQFYPIALSADGNALAICDGGNVLLWSVPLARCRHRLADGINAPSHLAFSRDGTMLAVGGRSSPVGLWDVQTGRKGATVILDEDVEFQALAFAPDGKQLLVASNVHGKDVGTLTAHDVRTGKCLRVLASGRMGRCLRVSPDGKMVACTRGDDEVLLLDWQTGKELSRQLFSESRTGELAFSPDSRTLAVIRGCVVERIDTQTGKLVRPAEMVDAPGQLIWSPDGTRLAMMVAGGSFGVWDATTGTPLFHRNRGGEAYTPSWSADGTELWVPTRAGLSRLDGRTGKELGKIPLDGPGTLYRSGTRIAGLRGGRLRFLEMPSGREVRSLAVPLRPLPGLGLSPDGKIVLGHTTGTTIRRYEVETGDELPPLWQGQHPLGWLEVPGAVPRLVVGTGRSVTVHVGDPGQELRAISMMLCGEHALNLATWRVAVDDESWGHLHVHDLATGAELATFPAPADWVRQPNEPTSWFRGAAFSPDGRLLAALGQDHRLHLWEITSGSELRVWPKPALTWAPPLVFSPDSRKLAVGGSLPTVWDVTGRHGQPAPQADALAALVADLNADDGRKANAAVWALIDAKAVEPLLPTPATIARVKTLIADLDADDFDVRDRAETSLKSEPQAEQFLWAALKARPTLDAKKRLEALLSIVEARAWPRASRLCAVLEHVGTPEARRLLADLAKGDDGSRLTHEARAALRRLERP